MGNCTASRGSHYDVGKFRIEATGQLAVGRRCGLLVGRHERRDGGLSQHLQGQRKKIRLLTLYVAAHR